jgi:uncharacterized protein
MGLSPLEKRVLLDLARGAATSVIQNGPGDEPAVDISNLPDALMEKKGLFVAIYKQGEPRGCTGTIMAVLPIWQACMENARSAAYKDPRFVPIAIHELDQLSFEVTLLDMTRPFSDISQLGKDIHGLILTKGFRIEVFLPGSLKDLPHDIDEIFARLKAKADMNDDDNDAPEQWELFDAQVISESTLHD